MDKLADALMKKETMESEDFVALLGDKPKVTSPFLPRVAAARVKA
jgi:hypothetical protein